MTPNPELPALPNQDERGRFTKGNRANWKHGAFADVERPELAVLIAEEQARTIAALGGSEAFTPTRLQLAGSFARAAVLAEVSFSTMLAAGGPVSGKGNKRAIFDVWDRLDEKMARRAVQLGLERHQRDVGSMSPSEWLAAQQTDRNGNE